MRLFGRRKLKPSEVTVDEDLSDNSLYPMAVGQNAKLDRRGCPILPPSHGVAYGRNLCTSYVGWSMSDFTLDLGRMIASETGQRGWAHVIDATGVHGRVDFALEYDSTYYTLANQPNLPAGLRPPNRGVSIFAAIQSQLGLQLDPFTAPLKTMVIRSVDRIPVEN